MKRDVYHVGGAGYNGAHILAPSTLHFPFRWLKEEPPFPRPPLLQRRH